MRLAILSIAPRSSDPFVIHPIRFPSRYGFSGYTLCIEKVLGPPGYTKLKGNKFYSFKLRVFNVLLGFYELEGRYGF